VVVAPLRGQAGDGRRRQPGRRARNRSSAGTKTPLDKPCRYSSGSTAAIFGLLRHYCGRIADRNRLRTPALGSMRLSLTRGTAWAVAYHQPPAALVKFVRQLDEVDVDLGLRRRRQRLWQSPRESITRRVVGWRIAG
jgi:hypothetical protein